MLEVRRVSLEIFRAMLGHARNESALIADMTSTPEQMPETATYYVSADGRSGFGVAHNGELIGVFSLERGRGEALVSHAVANGARRLDCFDGYLPKLYARHGFWEVARVANWTPGEPDVVFMERL
ncbi:hypothetical protein [Actinocorallia libanotica]|uniref:Acetyltransferase (GNAT) family protein n=1 Tax=Actinocorallia libanotica TaxID=46162 RepID=A0ABP4B4L6_9ACTN